MLYVCTGSYFRKYVIHLGAGVVYLARAWEALWCGILDTLRVKSGKFFIKTHRICGKFATGKDSLAESAEIWGSLTCTPTRKTCLHTYI